MYVDFVGGIWFEHPDKQVLWKRSPPDGCGNGSQFLETSSAHDWSNRKETSMPAESLNWLDLLDRVFRKSRRFDVLYTDMLHDLYTHDCYDDIV